MANPDRNNREKFSADLGETENEGLGILLGLFVDEETPSQVESRSVDAAERGRQLVDYLSLPPEQGGPGPSDGEEMATIIFRDIIQERQKKFDDTK